VVISEKEGDNGVPDGKWGLVTELIDTIRYLTAYRGEAILRQAVLLSQPYPFGRIVNIIGFQGFGKCDPNLIIYYNLPAIFF
jgi:hypothetical protein